jgi:hypothetical protein
LALLGAPALALAGAPGGGIPERVRELESAVATLEGTVAALQATVGTQAGRIGALNSRVAALEAGGAPIVRVVHCGAGESVAAALAQGARTWGPLTITIVGTCRETVVIARDATTLQGATSGDGLDGTALGRDLVQVAAQRVALRRLTLRTHETAVVVASGASLEASDLDIDGAGFGVTLQGGSTGVLGNATIRNSTYTQLLAEGAYLRLDGCLIEDGHADGVAVSGGTASISHCTIRRHASWGLSVFDNAKASLFDSEVRENSTGIYMTTGGAALVGSGVTLASNSFGIQERDGSVLYLGGGAVIESNSSGGVWVSGGSFVLPINVTIQGNGGSGISLGDTSVAGSWNASDQPVIQNNGGWGVACAGAPAVAQVQPSGYPFGTVVGNTLGASNCPSFGDPSRVP